MVEKITLTYAQSLDGKIATTTGESRYISEEGSLKLNQELRKEHDAIIVGIHTVIADDPMLTCRTFPDKSPLRVILDSSLRIPLNGKIAQTSKKYKTVVFFDIRQLKDETAIAFKTHIKKLEERNITVKGISADSEGHLNLKEVLRELGDMNVTSLMVEGGSSVLTSFLKKDLWNEMIVVTAVKIFGKGISSFGELGVVKLKDAILPDVKNITVLGNEVCWHLVRPPIKVPVSTRTVFFTAPEKVELRTEEINAFGKSNELFSSRIMAVSPGTEKHFYNGNFSQGKKSDPSIDCIDTDFSYPFSYGYINIVENLKGERFFGFLHHSEKIYANKEDLLSLAEELDDDSALFIPHMETALSIIHDTNPKLGDRILITGAGVVGTLCYRILTGIMGIDAVVFDINPEKKIWFPKDNFYSDKKQLEAAGPFDNCIDVSGSQEGLQTCIENSIHEGSITVASWYGEKNGSINLGGNFHWKRLKLISSQVSNMSPAMGTNWNKSRRLDLAVNLLKTIKTGDLLTHRYPMGDVAAAYKLFESKKAFYGLIALIPGG